MSKVRIYARNLAANWIGYGANLAVMFFLSPFVVHTLGNATYGVWSLLVSLTGYLGLVEIGVRVSTGRYINYYLGRGEPDKVSNVVSTSLAFYTGVSILVLGVAAGLGMFFGDIFSKAPTELAAQAKWILLLLGANIWLGFYSATFSQLLHAKDRFDLRNVGDVTVLAIRTAGTVWALKAGYGLVVLAVVQVASGLWGCAILYALARWKGPSLHFGRSYISRQTFKELFGFGTWAFVGNVSTRIVYYTDAAVIGLLLGVEQITFYSIGFMLIDYGRNLVGHVVHVVTPDIQKAAGRNSLGELRWLMIRGTRITMFFVIPLFVGFMFLGREFISLWMGPDYVKSAWILFILTISQFGALATRTCGSVLVGLGHVRFLGFMGMAEAGANLVGSVIFVLLLGWGIYGVALGTVIPMVVFNNFVQPIYTCRLLGMDARAYARDTVLRWGLAGLAFAAMCLLAQTLLPQNNWATFWFRVGLLSALYIPLGMFTILGRGEREAIFAARKSCQVDQNPEKGAGPYDSPAC